jgi:arylsulfatase A-like enzyme
MKLDHGHDKTIVNGISRIGYMAGGKAARWVDEDMADRITDKAVKFIEGHRDGPFFLYFATHDIHVPRVPHPRFRGATRMGPRGDAIVEFDGSVGQVLQALDKLKLTENTLVILTSDNGPVLNDGYKDDAVEKLGKHKPAGPLRGKKSVAFEGGTRVPFIVRWPNRVPAGGASDALVCQIDFLASLAALVNEELPNHAAPDSVNLLPALLGESQTGRDVLVEQARSIAVRQGPWKLIEPNAGPAVDAHTQSETGAAPQPQLYNLADDLAETKNLAKQHPEKVRELTKLLEDIRRSGRMP